MLGLQTIGATAPLRGRKRFLAIWVQRLLGISRFRFLTMLLATGSFLSKLRRTLLGFLRRRWLLLPLRRMSFPAHVDAT